MKPKRKILILIILGIFSLSLIATGGYLLYTQSNKKISLNKYPVIIDWCEHTIDNSSLSVACNALLIDISSENSNNSCFEVQIMTRDKKLQDLSICESPNSLQYSNEILRYKKLLPIRIDFTYQKVRNLNSYSFYNVNISSLSENYVQEIITDDIDKLLEEDASKIEIKNSINFCPTPELLPDYVSSQEKQRYSEYYNNNIMADKDSNETLYNTDDSNINVLFTCDDPILNRSCTSPITFSIQPIFVQQPSAPKWENSISTDDKLMIKQISMLYDNADTFIPSYLPYMNLESQLPLPAKTYIYQALINEISNGGNITEEAYCSLGHLLDNTQVDSNSYLDEMKSSLYSNIKKSTSPLCISLLDYNNFDKTGVYIKYYFTNKDNILSTYSRCLNLRSYLE